MSGLYRNFRRAGFSSPKCFVVGARVFRGYLYLQDAGSSIRDVAAKLGYMHPRVFAHQIERVLGERPSRVRNCIGVQEILRRLELWFLQNYGVDSPLVATDRSNGPSARGIRGLAATRFTASTLLEEPYAQSELDRLCALEMRSEESTYPATLS